MSNKQRYYYAYYNMGGKDLQMAKKIEKKISQPVGLTTADVEILKERIGNMGPEEQEVVASALASSIMDQELTHRRIQMGGAAHDAANDLRRVQKAWLK